MALEHYIQSGGKRLRCGYTTGTCAALAAGAAARLLLTGHAPETAALVTPKGWRVEVPVENPRSGPDWASCTVTKDGGDDMDVTHGLPIAAQVSFCEQPGITLSGGPGVGRVTRPGLDQPVGEWAINHVPREMICRAVEDAARALDFSGGLSVTISVPGGEEAAKKTFNPHLGVEGGISILGTSGIVEPMSLQALVDTMVLELRQKAPDSGGRLVLTPGNYGLDFLKTNPLAPASVPVVRCSNFIGEALDNARLEGFSQILLVGHLGKLVKVAGGVMNTHSRFADCRREIFCAPRQAVDLEGKTLLPLPFTMSRDREKQHQAHLEAAAALEEHLRAGRDVAMAVLGDVAIFSTYCYLMDILTQRGIPCEMIPGVPSFCAVAARLGRSLTTMNSPLHILPGGGEGPGETLDLPGTKVLMKAGKNHRRLLEELEERDLLERGAMVVNCGLPGEQIYPTLADKPDSTGYFTTLIIP